MTGFFSKQPEELRERMVEGQLRSRDIRDASILRAFGEVPRELFAPEASLDEAYGDAPYPIGFKQTISQPYVVALMLELLGLTSEDKVLEVGAGSGYVTALLGRIVRRAIGIERIEKLALSAQERIEKLGVTNAEVQVGDGSVGLPMEAPFQAILVSAAAPEVPSALIDQLDRERGKMVVPVGSSRRQHLIVVQMRDGKEIRRESHGCVFVRLIGKQGWSEEES